MKSDNQISQQYKPKKIIDVAKELQIKKEQVYNYGSYMCKIDSSVRGNKKSKLILVTSTSPNKSGIGKTTLSIGLNDSLNSLGKKSIVCLREPSLGPVFGLKGGACGGGYSQVYPIDDINLHFTGDNHAITTLNNLIASVIDNHIYQGNELNINKDNILFKRCLDINDRVLRDITIAQKKAINGVQREDGFILTVATELMAILGLSENLEDFTNKVEQIIIGYNNDNKPVYVKDLNMRGSIAVLIKNAIKPNLVQTLHGNPAIIHTGPFANIAHGTNSLIATKIARSLSDYTVIEAGFGSDLGAEKFLNLVCTKGDFLVDSIVLVTTIKSLKEYSENNNLYEGIKNNLKRHLDHLKKYNIDLFITLNHHEDDSKEDVNILTDWLVKHNYKYSINKSFQKGQLGAIDLAKQIINSEHQNNVTKIYELSDSLNTKINKVVKKVYGAKGYKVDDNIKQVFEKVEQTYPNYPICFAKTPMSFSDNKDNKTLEDDFEITITNIKVQNGAKFVILYAGNILMMPGLGKEPNVNKIEYDFKNNEPIGLS